MDNRIEDLAIEDLNEVTGGDSASSPACTSTTVTNAFCFRS